ncbi:sensor histidine kinase [Novispirillum itersonii]|uniref:histidine kinase n=1 Tax=Novispirillum itersonii TaxID=189 RepID=A0A7X0DMU9_NOVIT|nr:sensor histidine kinase [Novispirillum itersonii]MBB6211473.1 signal transduction histidine kinase [Novispirillum itersonii]
MTGERRVRFWQGLSARLMLLTVLFVMIAEVLIFAPSIGRFRLTYLQTVLADAHLALMAVEATPDGMVDMDLQRRLLANAGTLGMMAWRPDRPKLVLGPDMPPDSDVRYDIRQVMFFPLIADAFSALTRREQRIISVIGPSPKDPSVIVEALLYEQPMIVEMRDYGWRILALSAFISTVAAALVCISLHWLLVRPLRRLSTAMLHFQEDPEDPARILAASPSLNEVGEAERRLAALQSSLARALHQQKRLAAVGTGVSKIAHDLKGVLTTALLESDRLEQNAGESRAVLRVRPSAPGAGRSLRRFRLEVETTADDLRETTQGIARALERAIGLATSTLRYASEGPPVPVPVRLDMAALCADALRSGPLPCQGLETVGWVTADRDMLLRVLENLVRNAVEAGASRLVLSAEPAGAFRRILVRDNGRGLPAKARENLFRPFSGSARPGGTGLGLPIARDLLRAMGGDLELADTGPDGTTFVVRLPAG